MDDTTDQAAIEAARLLERAEWLNRARIDPSVTPSAFRVAATVAAMTGTADILRCTSLKLAFQSATSKPTLSQSLDRLAARRFISLKRKGRSASIEIRILGARSQATLRR